MNRILGGVLGLVLGMGCAHAQSGTLDYSGTVNDSSGSPAGSGSLVLVLVNTSGSDNGFSVLNPGSLSVGSVFDGTYQVVSSTQVDDRLSPGGFLNSITLTYGSGLNAGDQVAIVWVPGVTSTDGSLSAGASYGLYTQNNNSTWLTPPNGSSTDLEVNGGTATFTSMSAVPEPSTYGIIAGLAALAYAMWRRREEGCRW